MNEIDPKDKRIIDEYVMSKVEEIAKARMAVIEAGGNPDTVYIADIRPQIPIDPRPVLEKFDTGMQIFNMSIIMDYRVPPAMIYIMQGKI